MLNLNKPLRHLFRKNVTVKFLADCGDPRWPLVFGITDDIGTQVIQTNERGQMGSGEMAVIENAPEREVRYCNVFSPTRIAQSYAIGGIYPRKPTWGANLAGQLELTFEDGKLTEARVCS